MSTNSKLETQIILTFTASSHNNNYCRARRYPWKPLEQKGEEIKTKQSRN